MSIFFKAPLDIEIRLDNEESRKHVDVRAPQGRLEKLPIYKDGESVKGTVTLRTRDGRKVEHLGVKVQLLGSIDTNVDGLVSSEFLSLATELASPAQLTHPESYPFEFKNVEKQYESYRGKNAKLRYYLKVTVLRKSSSEITREKELWVFHYSVPQSKAVATTPTRATASSSSTAVAGSKESHTVKMDVGIEDCLHIEFEYSKSRFSLTDVIVGRIFFLLVRLKIKHMELSLIRRETVGAPPNQITDSETVVRFEIMDGAPVKGETIPIRLFLNGFDLIPTYRDVNKKFSTRTYLSLVLIDEDARSGVKHFNRKSLLSIHTSNDIEPISPSGHSIFRNYRHIEVYHMKESSFSTDVDQRSSPAKTQLLSILSGGPIYNDTPSFDDQYATIPINNPNKRSNQTVSLSAAGIRAVMYQLQSLYIRTPVKLFRPSRFDYLAQVRELANRHNNISEKPYRFRTHSSLGMLFHVIKKEGWKFIPDHVLPPLIANSATGLILYVTYLTSLDHYNRQHQTPPSQFNWYSPFDTWRAGFIAGAVQSLAAAPVDAIYTRSTVAEMLEGTHQNLWMFGLHKLKEIGLVGVFAGYGFSFIKESLGFAFYFSTFETVKTEGYDLTHKTIMYYRRSEEIIKRKLQKIFKWNDEQVDEKLEKLERYRSDKLLKSTFVLLAGASAACSLLAVQYPLSKIQKIHLSRLEALDVYSASRYNSRPFITLYYNSYIDTFNQIVRMKQKAGVAWVEAAYKGFVRNALTTIPATSVGLLVFEIMRTKLADNFDEILQA
ncbi:Vacuolar protein sorting-associated protein 26 [Spathaspora sp. JA1]|nr:Vacuolar protein sorting-associated protein 26 [Spathaspora sp. JA1]